MRALFILLAIAASVSSQQKALRSRQIGTAGQVVSRILGDYDSHTRPPVRGCLEAKGPGRGYIMCFKDSADHSSIVVITNLFINRVNWLGDRAEVDLYLRQQWEDSRLSYEVDPREGLDEVALPANRKIWTPDTYFSSGEEQIKSRKRTVVEPSGYVRNSEWRTVTVPVQAGASFPYVNTKTFTLRIGSYNYPIDDVVYLWANSPPMVVPVEVSSDLLKGSLQFEEAVAGDCVGNYTTGTYSCIDVTVTFSGGFFSSFCGWFLPLITLIVASWLHFWISPTWSVPRSISAALPFFIFATLFLFRQDLVSTSGMGCWLKFGLFLTFLSLVEYFVVICCGVRRNLRYLPNSEHDAPLQAAKETLEVAYDSGCASFNNNNGIDIISRVLFPLLFLIFAIFALFVF